MVPQSCSNRQTSKIKEKYKDKEYCNIELDLTNRQIKLPKLKWVKIKGYRNKESINGRIRSAVIRKDAERYYVSILVEEDVYKPMFTPQSIIGIDSGIKDLIVTSHNEKIKNVNRAICIKKNQKTSINRASRENNNSVK